MPSGNSQFLGGFNRYLMKVHRQDASILRKQTGVTRKMRIYGSGADGARLEQKRVGQAVLTAPHGGHDGTCAGNGCSTKARRFPVLHLSQP